VEGSPVDRAFFLILETLVVFVVLSRRQRVSPILRKNWAIVAYFLYAVVSIFWSDFPFVTFKHWIKGVGDFLVILIVVTEPNVSDAVRCLITRLGFVLLPMSVLFIKYYPLLGRRLTLSWTMEPIGAAQQKNGLGELCTIVMVGLLWRFREVYRDRNEPKRKALLAAICAVFMMGVWLLWMCNSMTSIGGLILASAVMFLALGRTCRRHPALVQCLMFGAVGLTAYLLLFQSAGSLVQGLGRDPTLTGRTDIWQFVLSIHVNRLVGSGYESFWMGSRLKQLWVLARFMVQEAHNGYIEMLLNLGWIGVSLLAILIVTGFLNVISAYQKEPESGVLRIALFLVAIITGLTEAAFRMMSPPWIVFLLATTAATWTAKNRVREAHFSGDHPTGTDLDGSTTADSVAPMGHWFGSGSAHAQALRETKRSSLGNQWAACNQPRAAAVSEP
jgi:O-antigen ligase